MICILKLMYCYWLMCVKLLEQSVILKNSYGLDPAHYYTAPGLAWSAMLKMTKQNLELISDIDMLLMIEKAKRGGISQVCSKRYAKPNNKISS